ncbi:hypothetical protein ABE85_05285 [Mitsuaria sp. 7]|nr:hypothetical protein ABE85_05285 [Mitsuaria sp. 7]
MTDTFTAIAAITTTPPLSVGAFYSPAGPTPGNVGLCLSGGGTRACVAGMGQLRALAHLQANGASLLSQVRALSTVSGGSWLGVPYLFLSSGGTSEADYLGVYNADQGTLTPHELGELPTGNAGAPMTSRAFSIGGIAAKAVMIYALAWLKSPNDPLPANMLWQSVIALNILTPQGLYLHGSNYLPSDMFTATEGSLGDIKERNPDLSLDTAYTFAAGASDTQRPFMICNMAMFDDSGSQLVPVQATGFFSGIVGAPGVADANDLSVGGGGVDSFALNATFVSASNGLATVEQLRPWSLTDIMGTSSAAFAAKVQELIRTWQRDKQAFREWMAAESSVLHDWIDQHLPPEHQADAKRLADGDPMLEDALDKLSLGSLIPSYPSWPVADPGVNPEPNQYADGGNLENTGLPSMLAYEDIDSVIVCVNSMQPITVVNRGVADGQGKWVQGSQVLVDDAIPPLFGYRPYDVDSGYVPYAQGKSGMTGDSQAYANNQVFESGEFAPFLSGLLAAASAGSRSPNKAPAILAQALAVLKNDWFGVQARDGVNIVWVYLNFSHDWRAQFENPQTQALIDAQARDETFPNYSTFSTHLSAQQINLLAHLSSWSLVSTEEKEQVFSPLFRNAPPPSGSAALPPRSRRP